jgi:hypothetical protein
MDGIRVILANGELKFIGMIQDVLSFEWQLSTPLNLHYMYEVCGVWNWIELAQFSDQRLAVGRI